MAKHAEEREPRLTEPEYEALKTQERTKILNDAGVRWRRALRLLEKVRPKPR